MVADPKVAQRLGGSTCAASHIFGPFDIQVSACKGTEEGRQGFCLAISKGRDQGDLDDYRATKGAPHFGAAERSYVNPGLPCTFRSTDSILSALSKAIKDDA